ncbi:MAG: peptide/nickel transport system substrate-binding protein [Hyphomicrobiales bacterium]|nr:peptide/nickel transport system substrate-binding protein [Hyphomicrobiales bacterium]
MRLILMALTALLSGAAAAQQPDLSQSGLVGKLENPTLVTDPAQWPKKFGEAPALTELVKAGKLPPVEQRLPQEPMVLKPLRSVGKYGGTWRRGFLGPGDSENGNRVRASDKLLFWDVNGTGIVPNVAKGWETSADGRRTTLFLRKGMKWSDGAPFTADDFMFWYEDMYRNKDLIKSAAPELSSNGKPGRISKVDETTVLFEFDDPHFLFASQLAGDTQVGGGQSRLQSEERELGLYAPAHYLKQFLPKYSSAESLNEKAKATGFDNWAQVFKIKSDWRLNPEVPTISAWRMVQPINSQTWVLERNPYFWTVDTAGNQLPYLDKVQLTLAENPEVINLRAIAGEYDYMERFIDLAKLPVFLENAARSKYKVHLDPGFNGSDSELKFNFAYRLDAEIQKWFANLEFRRALALGIDREQVNEAFFLGLGVTGTPIPADNIPESPGKDYRQRWATLDVAKANAMLDAIGLKKKDAEGFRLRTDNGERLRLQIDVAQTLSPTWPQQAEMIIQQWRAIGIWAEMRLFERSLFYTRVRNDQNQIVLWSNNGSESLYLYTIPVLPIDPQSSFGGAAYAQWYASNGAAGIKPTDPELLKGFELLRSAASQPEQRRVEIAQEIWKLLVDQVWSIGVVGQSPAYMGTRVVNERLENVPARTCVAQHCRTPWSGHPEQWYYR